MDNLRRVGHYGIDYLIPVMFGIWLQEVSRVRNTSVAFIAERVLSNPGNSLAFNKVGPPIIAALLGIHGFNQSFYG